MGRVRMEETAMMSHTVISVFDDFSAADNARDTLVSSGFPIAQVQLVPSEPTRDARHSALRSEGDAAPAHEWSFTSMLAALFGADPDSVYPNLYAEAIRRGAYLLTVDVDTDDARDNAIDILNRFDPFDLDERATQWREGGWTRYDATAEVFHADEGGGADNPETASRMPAATPVPESRVRSFARSPADADVSVTPAASAGTSASHDYLQHWEQHYKEADRRYEDDEAAYAYGARLRAREERMGADWNLLEPEARLEWESNNAGVPWERARHAVRYAWEAGERGRHRPD